MDLNPNNTFGIPITKGKLLSKSNSGFVVSFQLRHLGLKSLQNGQLFSEKQQPLTEIVSTTNYKEIFQFTLKKNSPELAIAQKEYSVIVFIKSPKFHFSENLRIVFWFIRYPKQVSNENDFIDIPDQHISLLIAKINKNMLSANSKEIPKELENEIKIRTNYLLKDRIGKNYYLVDTFNLSKTDIDKLSIEEFSDVEDESGKEINDSIHSKRLTQQEKMIEKDVRSIIKEISNMGYNSKSIKPYLQEKLSEIWNTYKNQKTNLAFGFDQKAFANKYFWEGKLETVHRYKDFNSFYRNIFIK